MNRISKLALLALCTASLSCGGDDPNAQDLMPPAITVTSPKAGDTFNAGGEIPFEAVIEDNIELAVYNVNIHQNFDGHSHGRLSASPFSYDKGAELSGRRATISEKISIPANAAPGPYHFIVKAIDNARNATGFADGSTKEIEIVIEAND